MLVCHAISLNWDMLDQEEQQPLQEGQQQQREQHAHWLPIGMQTDLTTVLKAKSAVPQPEANNGLTAHLQRHVEMQCAMWFQCESSP